MRAAVSRVEPLSTCTAAPSARRLETRHAAANRRSVTPPSLASSSTYGSIVPRTSSESRSVTSQVRSRYVVKPPESTRRPNTGPASTITGNRVARSDVVAPAAASTSRYDVPPIAVAASPCRSPSEASVSGDSASNGPNAPPLERTRTVSNRPGVPRPRMPNWESWADRRIGG